VEFSFAVRNCQDAAFKRKIRQRLGTSQQTTKNKHPGNKHPAGTQENKKTLKKTLKKTPSNPNKNPKKNLQTPRSVA